MRDRDDLLELMRRVKQSEDARHETTVYGKWIEEATWMLIRLSQDIEALEDPHE